MKFIFDFLKNLFSNHNNKILKKCLKIVTQINSFEFELQNLSTIELTQKANNLKKKINYTIEDILPEAFAVVKEISSRLLNMKHYDVQLIGGICLYYGNVIEMQTGEGKTLVAILPTYLNYLCNVKVHIVTVNDYLAKRDAEWMAPVYQALGMDIGIILSTTSVEERKRNYLKDVIYGTNNEFCFDYLRNNMIFTINDLIQNELSFAIIDEVDSVLIDEARTPLIISINNNKQTHIYNIVNNIISIFIKENKTNLETYIHIDEKAKNINFTEIGYRYFENILKKKNIFFTDHIYSLYSEQNLWLIYHLQIALKAHLLLKKNIDYIISKENEISIIDEHTGRVLTGRKWSGGLHQAIEVKENIKITQDNKTLSSITFQNYFRLYKILAGMTGTASTEEKEFKSVYNLNVIVIPTNKECIRKDYPDLIYLTKEEKYINIINDAQKKLNKLQPVLIGTTSIESSEHLSLLFKQKNILHNVLNAKLHEKEAQIIADAGKPGNLTIATNMAGRGTDIVLGGKVNNLQQWEKNSLIVKNVGGLHVIGTERHESRRIDNQLRGRCGRQGDPGSSQFYLSIQDNLLKLFLSEKLSIMFSKLWVEKNKPIEYKWVTKIIENSQKKIEGYYSDIRKQLLEFDDIFNEQRLIYFKKRNEIVKLENISTFTFSFINDILNTYILEHEDKKDITLQEISINLLNYIKKNYNIDIEQLKDIYKKKIYTNENLASFLTILIKKFQFKYQKLIEKFNNKNDFFSLEKKVLLTIMDHNWQNHIEITEYLRENCYLYSYAQKDPKKEYKKEIAKLFFEMINNIKHEYISFIFNFN